MKNLTKLLCLLAIFASVSCSGKENEEKTVKKVAENYLTAFKNFDIEQAKKYGTADAIIFLSQMQEYIDQCSPEDRKQAKANVKNVELQLGKIKIHGDRAKIAYKFVEKNNPSSEETLYLIKQNGIWKVQEFPNPAQAPDELFDF